MVRGLPRCWAAQRMGHAWTGHVWMRHAWAARCPARCPCALPTRRPPTNQLQPHWGAGPDPRQAPRRRPGRHRCRGHCLDSLDGGHAWTSHARMPGQRRQPRAAPPGLAPPLLYLPSRRGATARGWGWARRGDRGHGWVRVWGSDSRRAQLPVPLPLRSPCPASEAGQSAGHPGRPGPDATVWPQHRIPSTNQHPISLGTKWSIAHAAWGRGWGGA